MRVVASIIPTTTIHNSPSISNSPKISLYPNVTNEQSSNLHNLDGDPFQLLRSLIGVHVVDQLFNLQRKVDIFFSRMMRSNRQQDQQSRAFYELSALVLNLLRSPPTPISFSDEDSVVLPPSHLPSSSRRNAKPVAQITPAGFASLLLGVSLTLMLCGSVTFFIGFMLLPWIIGLLMILYVAGVVSSLSILGRSLFCYATATSNPPKDVTSWKLL